MSAAGGSRETRSDASLRAWIGVMAFACLAAGAGAGFLAARSFAPREAPPREGTFAEYEARLAEEFALSPERREILHAVLASYEAELAGIKDSHMADYMSSIEPELREQGRYYRGLVRDRVLPENQRPAFDRMTLGPIGTNP